jgi:hypothetical protein
MNAAVDGAGRIPEGGVSLDVQEVAESGHAWRAGGDQPPSVGLFCRSTSGRKRHFSEL